MKMRMVNAALKAARATTRRMVGPTFWLPLSGLVVVGHASAQTATHPVDKALRPIGECMVARDVRDWGVIGERRLVVHTLGGRYYDIALRDRCPDLQRRPFLSFREGPAALPLGSGRGAPLRGGDPVTTDGRICGDLGDAVVPRGGAWNGTEIPCRIASVRRIDKAGYDAVFDRGTPRREGEGAGATAAAVEGER